MLQSPKVSSLKVRSSKVPSPNVQSPKVQSLKGKRGRPPKVKEEPTEQLSSEVSSSNIDDFTERSSTIELITKHVRIFCNLYCLSMETLMFCR